MFWSEILDAEFYSYFRQIVPLYWFSTSNAGGNFTLKKRCEKKLIKSTSHEFLLVFYMLRLAREAIHMGRLNKVVPTKKSCRIEPSYSPALPAFLIQVLFKCRNGFIAFSCSKLTLWNDWMKQLFYAKELLPVFRLGPLTFYDEIKVLSHCLLKKRAVKGLAFSKFYWETEPTFLVFNC